MRCIKKKKKKEREKPQPVLGQQRDEMADREGTSRMKNTLAEILVLERTVHEEEDVCFCVCVG